MHLVGRLAVLAASVVCLMAFTASGADEPTAQAPPDAIALYLGVREAF